MASRRTRLSGPAVSFFTRLLALDWSYNVSWVNKVLSVNAIVGSECSRISSLIIKSRVFGSPGGVEYTGKIEMRSALIIILAASLSLITTVQARIGESKSEIDQRYGPGIPVDRPLVLGGTAFIYTTYDDAQSGKASLCTTRIMVHFWKDKSALETYAQQVVGAQKEILPAKVKYLLDVNAGGSEWQPVHDSENKKTWKRADGQLLAWINNSNTLAIVTSEFQHEMVLQAGNRKEGAP